MILNTKLNEFAARIAVENVPYPIKTPKEYNLKNYTELAAKIMNGEHIDGLHPTHDLMEVVVDNFNVAIQTIEELTKLENTVYLCELYNLVNYREMMRGIKDGQ
ncbi:hypothetical protein ABWF04_06195 [Pasteurella multocida]|uniref:hypothetical protein n=1 Tax=Pasteurella multocida TaxID=747 RepID=UPI002B4720AE|nr:hypothetical protein [Pasteurella multocida]WRK07749.1 hypothetical protein RFF38_02655 [Pasteurella multocida]